MSEGIQLPGEAVKGHLWQGGIGAFLWELIDDASLFPPAMLPMPLALAQHVEHRRGPYRWALARFVCPASRLQELLLSVPPHGGSWRLSVVLDLASDAPWGLALENALGHVSQFRGSGQGEVESLEVRLPSGVRPRELAEALAEGAKGVAPNARPFIELPFGEKWEEEIPRALEEIASLNGAVGAKVRCGGSRAQDFPTAAQLGRFINNCALLRLPLKATAGLHHPLPYYDPVLQVRHHGFLNVVGGALLAVNGRVEERELTELLSDDSPNYFRLDAKGFSWRDRAVAPKEIEEGRKIVTCFGSCSFLEPMEGLASLLGTL